MDVRAKDRLIREIDRFLAAGRELIPLKPNSKISLEKDWPTNSHTRRALHAYVNRRGCNIAWRLGPLDVVIDIDPRHAHALESEEIMTGKWGCDLLNEVCPTVHTGGSDRGRHYYTKLPAEVKIKTVHPVFDGIDFRRHGNYVLIPGCIHPETERVYRWDFFCPHVAPEMPEWLFNALWVDSPENQLPRREYGPVKPDRRRPYTAPSRLSIPEIKAHLSRIPATKYSNYDDWLKMGMSIHTACGGDSEGCELFVQWSISDPTYFDAEESARAKWKTFEYDKSAGITTATLVGAAMLEGGSPNAIPPELVFDEPIQASPSMMTIDEFKRSLIRAKRPEITEAVERACHYGPENWDTLRDVIKMAYQVRLSNIDALKREVDAKRRKEKAARKKAAKKKNGKSIKVADPAIDVVEYLLKIEFENGRHLIHAKNQEFYEFVGTHWEQLPENEIKQLIFNAAKAVQASPDNESKFKASALFAACKNVLEAMSARREDVFNFRSTPKAVINTKNAEVWINQDGTHTVKDHSPESYLLSVLNTTYVEEAKCPVFVRTLREIFQNNKDPKGMIRHLFEFFGYTMQPYKNIPTWWMFQGDGSNGKTFVFNVFHELLGTAVLPRPVEEFADSSRNNHAMASLVGKLLIMDDDAKVDAFLPESALKKLSEMKPFEANPKQQHPFTFMSCATPVMLINDWPRIRDLSWGLIRKAYILPFQRTFQPEEYDLNREPAIKENEMPGILNAALDGYNRLRSRGQFSEPQECQEAKEQWLQAANPLIEFFNTQLIKSQNGSSATIQEVYSRYRNWCYNFGGVRYPAAKNRFEISLKQLGFNVGSHGGAPSVLGMTLRGSAEDVFD